MKRVLVALLLLGLQLVSGAARVHLTRCARPLTSRSVHSSTRELAVGLRLRTSILGRPQTSRARIVSVVEGGGGGDGDGRGDMDGNDEGPQSFLDSVIEFLRDFIPTLTVCLLIRFFVVEPRYIPSLSMFPSFEIGDQLAVEKVTKRFAPMSRDEVVVFRPPPAFFDLSGKPQDNDALIKRIVAIAGDTVEVRNGALYVNGEQQDEPFIAERAEYTMPRFVVPEGCVFVLGDNRNHSFDSHYWGPLPEENIIGKAVLKYWPPWRLALVGTNAVR